MDYFELTARIKNSDREAFDILCRDRYASMWSYARLFVDEASAEDVVQDVLFALWQKRRNLDTGSNLQGYLIRSVYNRCMNILKYRSRTRNYESWYRTKISDIISNYLAPEYNPIMTKVFNAELGESISKAIESLPPRCGEVFRMSYIDGLTDKEISESLGISVSTVENHIYLALRSLRSKLAPEFRR